MRVRYSRVSSSELSLPEAISACSWATVASLCRVGTACSSCAAARVGTSKAATTKVHIGCVVMLFPLLRSSALSDRRNQAAAGALDEALKLIGRPSAVKQDLTWTPLNRDGTWVL